MDASGFPPDDTRIVRALAGSHRYMPDLIGSIEVLVENGLSSAPITTRMDDCAKDSLWSNFPEEERTEPGVYDRHLGGAYHGQSLCMVRENVGQAAIVDAPCGTFGLYAREPELGERFGDSLIRAGLVSRVTEGFVLNER